MGGGPLVGGLILLISGCSGSFSCTYETEAEFMEKILHEVEHATQTQIKTELKTPVETVSRENP